MDTVEPLRRPAAARRTALSSIFGASFAGALRSAFLLSATMAIRRHIPLPVGEGASLFAAAGSALCLSLGLALRHRLLYVPARFCRALSSVPSQMGGRQGAHGIFAL